MTCKAKTKYLNVNELKNLTKVNLSNCCDVHSNIQQRTD